MRRGRCGTPAERELLCFRSVPTAERIARFHQRSGLAPSMGAACGRPARRFPSGMDSFELRALRQMAGLHREAAELRVALDGCRRAETERMYSEAASPCLRKLCARAGQAWHARARRQATLVGRRLGQHNLLEVVAGDDLPALREARRSASDECGAALRRGRPCEGLGPLVLAELSPCPRCPCGPCHPPLPPRSA